MYTYDLFKKNQVIQFVGQPASFQLTKGQELAQKKKKQSEASVIPQVMVYLFDVLAWCYGYTALWMFFSEAPCSYWMWLIAFRMTAVTWSLGKEVAS